jgi:ankyrin repeat protein
VAWLDAMTTTAQIAAEADRLLAGALAGDAGAVARIRAAADPIALPSARLAVANEYHVSSWRRLDAEVRRRRLLDVDEIEGMRDLLARDPDLARKKLSRWADLRTLRIRPLGYLARARAAAARRGGLDRTSPCEMARLLVELGAPVDGGPGDPETPLVSAAAEGDVGLVGVLVAAGADLEAIAAPDAAGVPEGSALLHAAVFGRTAVLDLLVAAGAHIPGLGSAAAAGDISGWSLSRSTLSSRIDALSFAALHERLDVIDALLDAGTPIDAEDREWGRQPLRIAARHGRTASVAHLLARGADPRVMDQGGHRRDSAALSPPRVQTGTQPDRRRMAQPLVRLPN